MACVNLALDTVEIALIGVDQFHKLSWINFQFADSIQINRYKTVESSSKGHNVCMVAELSGAHLQFCNVLHQLCHFVRWSDLRCGLDTSLETSGQSEPQRP